MDFGRLKTTFHNVEGNVFHIAPVPIVYKVLDEEEVATMNKQLVEIARREYSESVIEVPDERHRESLGKEIVFKDDFWREDQEPAIGIWHGVPTNNFLNLPFAPITQLRKYIEQEYLKVLQTTEGVTDKSPIISESWIQFYKQGDRKVLHNHERYCPPYFDYKWAGSYYIDDGAPDKAMPYSGIFSFRIRNSNYYIKPVPNLLLLFPAEILHEVHTFYGARERVVINFNINAE